MSAFDDKTAVVIGATSGIGLAIAEAFLAAGANVIGAGLPPLPAPWTRSLDIADGNAVNEFFAALDSVDYLVNAAGIIRRDDEFNQEIFEQVVDINLHGTMRCTMAAKPLLARSKGAVVNVASMLSFFGGPRVPAYSASKGAVSQLTRSLAVAWAAEGIRVNAIAPGWIATPLTSALHQDPARAEPLLARTPFKRWGQPEEIAPLVLFLCSDGASFITGAIIPIDGGYSAA